MADFSDDVKQRFGDIQKRYEKFRKEQVMEDPDLVNVDQMTKEKIAQGLGSNISPEEFQKMNQRGSTPPPPKPPPFQGHAAPPSETSPESQAGYARAMEMIKQRTKDKALDQHLQMSPEQRMQQAQIEAKRQALEDMERNTDFKRMSDEFAGTAEPLPVPETPEEKMYRAMYGRPMPKK